MSENDGVGSDSGLVPIIEGEWAGWSTWPGDSFEQSSGPFYERIGDDGRPVAAFRAEDRHMNGAGFMHGGCLMTFADSAIFTIAHEAMGDSHGVTLSLTGDFLDPVSEGQFLEARGEVVRAGGKTIFIQGLITADGKPALRFNAIIRKIRS
ncbi:PaaI family thioesterase [Parasphingopyxis sp. CP4]|uniref:PaaI family thioesterase n=1 Tax=Parasphingopyxis sp. CP4 TaxID=2724527 RepID=UPI0015A3AA2D|nr:PaaI family thioesterase [Parasphingopyxis sp. CP4]QLC21702.1 PaaI family thioesterase [Parasphingopyxis sp. CP4]